MSTVKPQVTDACPDITGTQIFGEFPTIVINNLCLRYRADRNPDLSGFHLSC